MREDRGFACANRKSFKAQNESMSGENASINCEHGPAHRLRNSAQYA
jgi:hypothetical protein